MYMCMCACFFLPTPPTRCPMSRCLPASRAGLRRCRAPSERAAACALHPERNPACRPAACQPNQNLREKRRCAPARRQKVNSPEFLAICGRAPSSRRRRHDSDAADRLPFRQGISGAARQATAPLLMTIGRRGGERCAGADGSNTPHGHRASPAEACSSQGLCKSCACDMCVRVRDQDAL